jgi:hypothetical protein
MKKKLTKESVTAALSYDPKTGVFTRIDFFEESMKRNRPDFLGKQAGSVCDNGYVEINLGKRRCFAHRLAFLIMTGEIPAYIDHKDGDKANNRWENLRACNMSQNMANRGPTLKSTSGVKGVYLHKPSGRWRAQIMVAYKSIHLGYFKTIEDAAKAYSEACSAHFGEFAKS